ncbi:MAG: polyamine ABC transporter substrate-binding protein [Proteobacteria bacterium]|nr:polyamine ABC transporter substrate-binding protein [Pseudomonadota bacterium]
MMSGLLRRAAALALLAGMIGGAQAQQTLKVFNWSDYVDPKVLEDFTKETGIKVVYDTFDQMETVETKLTAGKSGYDLVVVTASFLPRHIPLKLYQELDKSKLQNLQHMWGDITQRLAKYDPGNKHAVNYMWGTTGLGYNVTKIKERLGKDATIDSWAILFDPERLKKVADCGVHVLDATEELFPAALRYLGLDPDSKKEADLRKAADLLAKIKPHIRKFHSSEYINALANGDICLALGYSGDVLQARKRAREAKNGVEVAYSIPKEGALMWFDSLVIPADAENKTAAYAFIDYLNRPEIAGKNSSFVQYASGNLAAQKHADAEVVKDPGIYPGADVLARLYTITPHDEKTQKIVNRLLTRVKTAK